MNPAHLWIQPYLGPSLTIPALQPVKHLVLCYQNTPRTFAPAILSTYPSRNVLLIFKVQLKGLLLHEALSDQLS